MRWLKSLGGGQVFLIEVCILLAVPILMYAATKVVEDEVLGGRVWVGIWAIASATLVAVPWAWLASRSR